MKRNITIKNAEKAVFGSKIKGFQFKSKKEPGIDQPKPKGLAASHIKVKGKKLLY